MLTSVLNYFNDLGTLINQAEKESRSLPVDMANQITLN